MPGRLLRPLPHVIAAASLALAGAVAVPSAGARADDRASGPALVEPARAMADALHCQEPRKPTDKEPVLFVHGITATGAEEFEWSWMPLMLARGRAACTIDLPERGMGDNQRSAEYVVSAIRAMSRRFGSEVDVVAASQGPMAARWALRWWPDIRAKVDDFVSIAGIVHGSQMGELVCASGRCVTTAWQWKRDSKFISALNSGDESPGDVDYTALSTKADYIVFPQVPESVSAIDGAVNAPLDTLCPGRAPEHAQTMYDAVTYAATMDALDHEGPLDPKRVDPAACAELFMPGVDPGEAAGHIYLIYETGVPLAMGLTWPTVDDEPPLRAYADPH